jgi:serine/threonine protein kinase
MPPVAPAFGELGPYRLLELIGSGAVGEVYRGVDVTQGRSVAIKVLRFELAWEPVYVSCFNTEARAASCLEHPNVIKMTDVVDDFGSAPWLVMELLEGCDLATLLARGPLGVARSLQIARQVCDALTAIHDAGIVHRDIKPQNLFITSRDGQDFVKVIDFGVAQFWDPSGAEPAELQVVGTPEYMAPEQATLSPIGHRADLYAVGAVLFEALTGAPPFVDADVPALLRAVAADVPPVLSEKIALPNAVRADLEQLIGSCLAKDPARRPQSALEIAVALDRLAARLERNDRCGTFSLSAAL